MYKKNYTKEEMAELEKWFKDNEEKLPTKLQLNAATLYNNLPATVRTYFEIYEIHGNNPTFSGQYHQLWLIKDKLIEDGLM